jgi:hypothetical protein
MIEILAILEAEIRRIVTWGQPGQIVHELPSPKQPKKKKMDWKYGSNSRAPILQAQNPEFKLQFTKKGRKTEGGFSHPFTNCP